MQKAVYGLNRFACLLLLGEEGLEGYELEYSFILVMEIKPAISQVHVHSGEIKFLQGKCHLISITVLESNP